MQKILRVITRLNIGGPAVHAALLSTQLAPQRFSTVLVVGKPDPREGDLRELLQGERVRLIRLTSLRRPIRPWADLVTFIRLLGIVWTERPQLIHTHMAKAGTLGRLAGLAYNRIGPGRWAERAILLHTFHGHVLSGYFPGWVSRIFLVVERWLARRTDCLIAVSDTVRHELSALGIGRAAQWRVIPVGLDLSALAQLPVPNGKAPVRCGFVGRLVPVKNPSLFLGALHHVIRQGRHAVRGVVAGDGPLRPALEREARALGLQGFVRFTGWQRDLPALYNDVDVACLTSWNEGTPVALIEAMAAGRAVVATRVGGVRDLLEADWRDAGPIPPGTFRLTERGVLTRPGDAEGLAKAMTAVAEDGGLRRRLGEAGRTFVVERFTSERLLRDIAGLYDGLLASQSNEEMRCGRW